MTTKNDQILIIVITRLHTGKGSSDDEYQSYWAPTEENQDDCETDDFFWKPELTPNSSFLLIHGYRELEDKLLKKGFAGFYFSAPEKFEAKTLENIFQKKGDEITLETAIWQEILCFVHGSNDVVDKIDSTKPSGEISVFDYTSANILTAPQHLLKRLDEKLLNTADKEKRDKIIAAVQSLLNGLVYKRHLLGGVQELLLRIRLNVEIFLEPVSEKSTHLDEAVNTLQTFFVAPKSGQLAKDYLRDILLKPPLHLKKHDADITAFFKKIDKSELWSSLKQLLALEQEKCLSFLSQQQYLSKEPLSENAFKKIRNKLAEAARCVALLKDYYTEKDRKSKPGKEVDRRAHA